MNALKRRTLGATQSHKYVHMEEIGVFVARCVGVSKAPDRQYYNMAAVLYFPCGWKLYAVVSTVFSRSLADQLENLVSRHSDCL